MRGHDELARGLYRSLWRRPIAAQRRFWLPRYREIARRVGVVRSAVLHRSPARRRKLFDVYFHENYWGDAESRSGPGSNLAATENIRRELPPLLTRYGIRTLLDVPCGDAHWIRHLDYEFDQYIGADVVPAIIEHVSADARAYERFVCLDAISDDLPSADAVMCRDFFIHLSWAHISAVLANVRRSGARYLIASNFPGRKNVDMRTGGFRVVDLEVPPFSLGSPLASIDEGYERYPDKVLSIWGLTQ